MEHTGTYLIIRELTLKNFKPILSGLGKEEMHLDLRESTSRIHVFIGKIGSAKTYILSHLQPYATVGTMDIRNADDPILPEKDGFKEIVYHKVYSDHYVEYRIQHYYNWTSTKNHSKKSYFMKDGEELNPNGNQSSFQEIVSQEFGIDPSYLRLMRLGPNVINFINMKATERKSYIASLLKETEFYLALYKNWSVELRTLHTKTTILMNKMKEVGQEDELNIKLMDLEDLINDFQGKINEIQTTKTRIEAKISAALKDRPVEEVQKEITRLEEVLDDITKERESILERLQKLDREFDEDRISADTIFKSIGKYESLLSREEENIETLQTNYEEIRKSLNVKRDRLRVSSDQSHMAILRETKKELLDKIAEYDKMLNGFQCKYSSQYILTLMDELTTVSMSLTELYGHDRESVDQILHSDGTVLNYAKNRLDVLYARQEKIRRRKNNADFSKEYITSEFMYVPPFCPTKTCPYYKTHPFTMKKELKKEYDRKIAEYQNELKEIEIQIYRYTEYPIIHAKIQVLRGAWKKYREVLSELHALRVKTLDQLVLQSQGIPWYDYDTLVEIVNKLEVRDNRMELSEKMKEIEIELSQLERSNEEDLEEAIKQLEKESEEVFAKLKTAEEDKKVYVKRIQGYNSLYTDLSKRDILEKDCKDLESQIQSIQESLRECKDGVYQYEVGKDTIEECEKRIAPLYTNMKKSMEDADKIRAKIQDIQYTKSELEESSKEYQWMTYMVDAVGSKKGIPMVMVNYFFESCRNTINDMLNMVTEDEFYIEPFEIGESEFLIPYSINGHLVGDISQASQGQTSIASTVISFAIVKELNAMQYNIPLLDEMDGALAKGYRQKFLAILMKYLEDIGSEQCFVITHNENTFDGQNVQILLTSEEHVNDDRYANAIALY